MRKLIGILACSILMLFLATGNAHSANIAWDNGTPSAGAGISAGMSDRNTSSIGPYQRSDDFNLTAGKNSISSITWWGFHLRDDFEPVTNFDFLLYEDIGGNPSITEYRELIPVGEIKYRVYDDSYNTVYEYTARFDNIAVESDKAIWLSIINNTKLPTGESRPHWFWSVSGENQLGGPAKFRDNFVYGWRTQFGSEGAETAMAFQISTVPIPAAAWLFGSALIGLVAVGRRRQQGSSL